MGKSEERNGRSAFIRLREETTADYFEWKFFGKEQEFEAEMVSHWLQVVIRVLLLGREGSLFL